MFGCLVPIKKKEKGKGEEEEKGGGIQLTGAVQFNPGQSLHAVEVIEIAGTGGFASDERKRQKTFRREFIVPYALIGFYGVINEHLAEETMLTESDVNLLMEALWFGTMSLHSRSKAFHHPRLLLRFDFKDEVQCGYFLDRLELKPKIHDERHIRSPKDYEVDLTLVLKEIEKRKEHLVRVECWIDTGITLLPQNLEEELKQLVDSKGKLIYKQF
jgi:CRISPR-associated protein Csh2